MDEEDDEEHKDGEHDANFLSKEDFAEYISFARNTTKPILTR